MWCSAMCQGHSGCAEGQYWIEGRNGNQRYCCQATTTAEGWVSENEGAASALGTAVLFLPCDSKKGHFQLLDMGMWVVVRAGWIWGKD